MRRTHGLTDHLEFYHPRFMASPLCPIVRNGGQRLMAGCTLMPRKPCGHLQVGIGHWDRSEIPQLLYSRMPTEADARTHSRQRYKFTFTVENRYTDGWDGVALVAKRRLAKGPRQGGHDCGGGRCGERGR